jgi:acyl carrier protein
MTPQEIEAKVKDIICKELEVSPEQVKPETSFTDDLKADSIAVVELVIKLEEGFGIEIPEEDVEQMKTVGDAIGYLKSHVK